MDMLFFAFLHVLREFSIACVKSNVPMKLQTMKISCVLSFVLYVEWLRRFLFTVMQWGTYINNRVYKNRRLTTVYQYAIL